MVDFSSLFGRGISSRPFVFAEFDPDAQAYINAVEAADGQALETTTKNAINTFFVSAKANGYFQKIKACCILAGARTLSGALIPVVGTAPTNFNFVSGDYNRKTGLKGDGSTKYLNSNRNNNADPQNNQHMAVFVSVALGDGALIGDGDVVTGATHILANPTANRMLCRNRSNINSDIVGQGSATGFVGMSRGSSTSFSARSSSTTTVFSVTSQTPASGTIRVLSRSTTSYTPNRISFYSIGESLTLSLLDTDVTNLMTAIAAAF